MWTTSQESGVGEEDAEEEEDEEEFEEMSELMEDSDERWLLPPEDTLPDLTPMARREG